MADYINVTSLNRLAKQVLAQCEPLNDLIVCGEISGFVRHYKSGHMYFTLKDEAAVAALLPKIRLAIRLVDGAQHIYLNGEDVSDAIRAENIGMAASAVSAHPPVRAFLLDTQRGLAADQNILMDGRDIGTVVLPNATVKIFLTATPEARAERRYKELLMKGEKHDYQNVLADVRARDYQDGTQHFYLNGEDVSSAIRAEEIGMAASAVAAWIPKRLTPKPCRASCAPACILRAKCWMWMPAPAATTCKLHGPPHKLRCAQ